MVDLSIAVHDGEEAIRVSTTADLNRMIHLACEEARVGKMLNIVSLEAPSGNTLVSFTTQNFRGNTLSRLRRA
jgi:hypothetical protein